MEEILCFVIEKQHLFLDQILVDFNGYPLFYICKSAERHYFVLCTDVDNMEYCVVTADLDEINRLFTKKVSMRDVFVKKTHYWHVVSGETIEKDRVVRKNISAIDISSLPVDGAFFEIFTEEIKQYAQRIDMLLCEPSSYNIQTALAVNIEVRPLKATAHTQLRFPAFSYDQQAVAYGWELPVTIHNGQEFGISPNNVVLNTSAA